MVRHEHAGDEGDQGDALFLVLDGELDILLGEGTPDEVIAEARHRVLGAGGSGVADNLEMSDLSRDDGIIDLDSQARPVDAEVTAEVLIDDHDFDPQPAVVDEVDQVLSEPSIAPQDEDALSRLVREAMQRAVESARGSESG